MHGLKPATCRSSERSSSSPSLATSICCYWAGRAKAGGRWPGGGGDGASGCRAPLEHHVVGGLVGAGEQAGPRRHQLTEARRRRAQTALAGSNRPPRVRPRCAARAGRPAPACSPAACGPETEGSGARVADGRVAHQRREGRRRNRLTGRRRAPPLRAAEVGLSRRPVRRAGGGAVVVGDPRLVRAGGDGLDDLLDAGLHAGQVEAEAAEGACLDAPDE